ncbi:MAG: hypothetical protein AAB680_01850, partial [Pseudomonadota bacterium]
MNPISNNSPPNLRPLPRVTALTDTKQAFLRQLEQLRANSGVAQAEAKPLANDVASSSDASTQNIAASPAPKSAGN